MAIKTKLPKKVTSKRQSSISEFDKSLKKIRSLVLKDKSFVERPIQTGYSYFRGNARLLKLVRSTDEVILEINTDLPDELSELEGLRYIPYKTAHAKHLGTIKYIYNSETSDDIGTIVAAALKQFKTQLQ